jgi:hypothetical protein
LFAQWHGGEALGASHAATREIDTMADWYYTKDGQQQGPVTSAQLRQLAQSGELQPTDMVFKEGGSQWVAASTIANLFSSSSSVASRPSPPARSRDDRDDRDDRGDGSLAFDDRGDDDDDAPIRRKPKTSGGGGFVDFLLFKKLVGPWIVIVGYWLGVIIGTCFTLFSAAMILYAAGSRGILIALLNLVMLPIAIIVYRLLFEILIVVFRIYETLLELKKDLQKRDKS